MEWNGMERNGDDDDDDDDDGPINTKTMPCDTFVTKMMAIQHKL